MKLTDGAGGANRVLTVEVMGPLRVTVAGRPIELPAGRLRTLLAVSAMSAGRTVPADRLALAVWGPDARGDVRANVRTNVMRLRRTLGTAGGELVEARAGGYLLAAEPDRVDALRFGRLLDEAAAAPDPAAERSRLAAALALWRGTPFDGIRSDWLEQSAAPALRERYLTALERRVDLDLAALLILGSVRAPPFSAAGTYSHLAGDAAEMWAGRSGRRVDGDPGAAVRGDVGRGAALR